MCNPNLISRIGMIEWPPFDQTTKMEKKKEAKIKSERQRQRVKGLRKKTLKWDLKSYFNSNTDRERKLVMPT